MHFTIVIPTYKRIKKLQRCIDSILANTHKEYDIFVMCDNNDKETFDYLYDKYSVSKIVLPILITEHKYVMGCWNHFTKHYIDRIPNSLLWLVDDVELYPNTLENLSKCFTENFSDNDGVTGLSQECPGHPNYTYKPYGQSVIGRKFLERYKEVDYQLSCLEYTHFFQDEEMYQYATSLNKFVHCKKAILKHYHPCFIKSEIDETHYIVRSGILQKDQDIFKRRQEQGLIWGKTFKLLGK